MAALSCGASTGMAGRCTYSSTALPTTVTMSRINPIIGKGASPNEAIDDALKNNDLEARP